MIAPKKGIFRDIPFSQYAKIEALNNSYLSRLAITPAHAKQSTKETAAMTTSRAGHTLILEGEERFHKEVIEADAGTITAKAYTNLQAANPGKDVILRGETDLLKILAEKIRQHPTAGDLLRMSEGYREMTCVAQDPETGLWVKARLDLMVPDRRVLADLKLVRGGNAEPQKFFYEVRDRYATQAAFHRFVANLLLPEPVEYFSFIVAEKEEPYRVEVIDLDPDWFAWAERENRRRIQTEVDCRERNFWPNWQNAGTETLYLPKYLEEAI